MNRTNNITVLGLAAIVAGALVSGCSHSTTPSAANSSQLQSPGTQSASAASFNPTVPPPTATPANSPCYQFQPAPAPLPPPTQAAPVTEELHRYLHVVHKANNCYLVDRFGHYYDCGRNSSGNFYPVYQDPVTDAVYPLYYDDRRDNYYRCVYNSSDNDVPSGYYRNYIGDSEDQFYEGDSDQEEECQSDDSQPFVVNYYCGDSGDTYYRHHHWHGYNPEYGYWSGENYHQNDLIAYVPVIVAAYIIFNSSQDNDNGGGYYNSVVVNNHYYYQRNVFVNNYGGRQTNAHFIAQPGPPLGHFGGYRGGFGRGHNLHLASANIHALPPPELPGARNLFRPATGPVPPQYNRNMARGENRHPFGGPQHQQFGAAGNAAHPNHAAAYIAAGTVGAIAAHHKMTAENHRRDVQRPVEPHKAMYAGAERRPQTFTHVAGGGRRPLTPINRSSAMNVITVGHRATLINRSKPGGRTAYAMRPAGAMRKAMVRPNENRLAQSNDMAQIPQQRKPEQTRTPAVRRQTETYRPAYQAPRPQHKAVRPTYHAARPQYEAPRPSYHAPRPQYQAPKAHYMAPRPQYQAPHHQYEAPRPAYQAPRPQYHAPRQQAPQQSRGGGGGGRPGGGDKKHH